jgi:glycine cleavage system aminomethyltransferase T
LLSYRSDITLDDNPFTIGMSRFVDFSQPEDFIGKAALQKIHDEGPARRLVGIEIGGDPLATPNEDFWDIVVDGEKRGHVTRCVFSPRLEKNIGWANVPTSLSAVGTALVVANRDGNRPATVCDAPWFPAQIRIPDELKSQA